jgi:hypothetical protein
MLKFENELLLARFKFILNPTLPKIKGFSIIRCLPWLFCQQKLTWLTKKELPSLINKEFFLHKKPALPGRGERVLIVSAKAA